MLTVLGALSTKNTQDSITAPKTKATSSTVPGPQQRCAALHKTSFIKQLQLPLKVCDKSEQFMDLQGVKYT